uniref:protein O-GlcNAcase-like n=1 Tax=Styela clava TaxID=7725 RepID=UPI0019396C1B|nr:protein O-GlcNAcase-like [Styela clava]
MSYKDENVEMSVEIATSSVSLGNNEPSDENREKTDDLSPAPDAENEMGQLKSKLKKIKGKKNENKEEGENKEVEIEFAEGDGSFMCGVVEGFYGRPWTTAQRKELFQRMKSMGMNTYLYGPKDDYKHRLYWRDLYSMDETALLKLLIDAATEQDILFIYAISPGLDMSFASDKEVECLKSKLLQVQSLGCKAFALLFDDIDPILCAADKMQYASAASAQAGVTNQMYQLLGGPKFLFCPTEYCNSMAIPDVKNSLYLKTIGNELNKNISIMWTGPKVVSKHISVESIKELTESVQRKIVIWDNIHANDYDPKRVFLGPYKGRSTHLIPHLSGVLTNPNCEFESNYIAMHTLASWWKSYQLQIEIAQKNNEAEAEKKLDIEMENVIKKSDIQETVELKEEPDAGKEQNKENNGEKEETNEKEASSSKPSQDESPNISRDLATVNEAKVEGSENPKSPKKKDLKNKETTGDGMNGKKEVNASISPLSSKGSSLMGSEDSDTDSDYSSHEEYFSVQRYSVSPPFDHGAYDPEDSLRQAIRSWLPYFSATRLPLGKPIARSGPPLGMLSQCDVSLISNAPMGPTSSTTNVLTNDPIPSTPFAIYGYGSASHSPNIEIKTDSAENEAKDDSANDVTVAVNDSLHGNEISDVEMAGATPNRTPPSVTQVPPDGANELKSDNKPPSDLDVDMKPPFEDENMQMGDSEDSPVKRIESTVQMEIEDEEERMQFDAEADSDVSMTTNNSTEEKKNEKVEDDKDRRGSLSGSSVDMATPPHQLSSSANQSPAHQSTNVEDETASTSKETEIENEQTLYKMEQMTLEDVELAVELFYLPYEHGGIGRKMVEDFIWLQQNVRKAVASPNASKSMKNDTVDKALAWMERAILFEDYCVSIRRMCNRLTSCSNRALLYDLFPYFWDMKGVVSMLSSYVKWMGQFYLRHQTAKSSEPSETGSNMSKPASPEPSSPTISSTTNQPINSNPLPQFPPPPPAVAWLGMDPEPWVFRGGLAGEFQRLLPVTMANDLFCQVIPCSPQTSTSTYIIRPYLPTDEKSVYKICLTTGNDGTDFADDFTGYEDLPGERLVGGLLTLSPEYCFILEDEQGICGYLVATADAKAFWKKYSIAFSPDVGEKYSLPKEDVKEGETGIKIGEEVRRLLDEIRSKEPPDAYAVDNLYTTHPAYMQIAVHRRVSDPSIAKSMTVCLLSALKSHGVHGVHTTVRSSDCYMPDLYCRLGFHEIRPLDPSPVTPAPSTYKDDTAIVFGRTF